MDTYISEYLNGITIHSSILTFIVEFFADDSAYLIISGVLIFCFIYRDRFVDKVTFLSALIIGSFARILVKPLFAYFFPRARPFIENTNISSILSHSRSEDYQSMPSGHTLFFFGIATVIYMHNKKWGLVFYFLSIIVGISRVAGGVHYASDILVGAILGIIFAYILNKLFLSDVIGIKTLLEKVVRIIK